VKQDYRDVDLQTIKEEKRIGNMVNYHQQEFKGNQEKPIVRRAKV